MIESILAIICGLLLLSDLFGGRSGSPTGIRKPVQTIVGVVALVVGVLSITSVIGVALVIAGLVLASSALTSIPRVGGELHSAGKWLARFRILIGIFVLLVGIMSLLPRGGWGGPPADRGPPAGVPPR